MRRKTKIYKKVSVENKSREISSPDNADSFEKEQRGLTRKVEKSRVKDQEVDLVPTYRKRVKAIRKEARDFRGVGRDLNEESRSKEKKRREQKDEKRGANLMRWLSFWPEGCCRKSNG